MTKIGDRYLGFLVDKITSVGDMRASNYHFLCSYLFDKNFVWMPDFPLDSDRKEDGYALRGEFISTLDNPDDCQEFFMFCQGKECSVLEMLVALCIRICNEVYSDPKDAIVWLFWSMISNLGIAWADDRDWDVNVVDGCVESWLYRKNEPGKPSINIFQFNPEIHKFCGNMTIWDQANLFMRDVN